MATKNQVKDYQAKESEHSSNAGEDSPLSEIRKALNPNDWAAEVLGL